MGVAIGTRSGFFLKNKITVIEVKFDKHNSYPPLPPQTAWVRSKSQPHEEPLRSMGTHLDTIHLSKLDVAKLQ